MLRIVKSVEFPSSARCLPLPPIASPFFLLRLKLRYPPVSLPVIPGESIFSVSCFPTSQKSALPVPLSPRSPALEIICYQAAAAALTSRTSSTAHWHLFLVFSLDFCCHLHQREVISSPFLLGLFCVSSLPPTAGDSPPVRQFSPLPPPPF